MNDQGAALGNYAIAVYVVKDPEAVYRCRYCGEAHRWGAYLRNEHRLMVACASRDRHGDLNDSSARLVTIPEAFACAAESATDGGSGIYVACWDHEPSLSCPGGELRTAIAAGGAVRGHV